MIAGQEKLHGDLEVLTAMAGDMEAYLNGEALYWPLSQGDMPKLTLGGYLMRQYRLQKLSGLLSEDELQQLETAVAQFGAALVEKIVRTEQRAHEELGVRTRQWGTYLNDVRREAVKHAVNYPTAVENRLMVDALLYFLQTEPYRLEAGIARSVSQLDNALRNHWQAGEFIWDTAWMDAYPLPHYWWLYGHPK